MSESCVSITSAATQWTQCFPFPFPSPPGRLAVVPFMHVFEKSRCQSREVLVDIYQEYPDHIEHRYIPSCVVVKRCSGFCNDEAMECVPTRTRNVTMTVSTRASLTPLTSPPSLRLFVRSSCLSLLLSFFLPFCPSFIISLGEGRVVANETARGEDRGTLSC